MARNDDDNMGGSDHLDQLLRGFQTRNEFRSDPNYVLEPVHADTRLTDRFVKILRESSLPSSEEELNDPQQVPVEQETNSGLILLAEQYEKNSRTQAARSRVFSAIAAVILLAAVITFAAIAQLLIVGIIVAVIALVFIVLSRTSAKQAEEIQQIASALAQPEEAS